MQPSRGRSGRHKLLRKVAIAEVSIVETKKVGSLVVITDLFNLFCSASCSHGGGSGVGVED